jgi:hypothetical protein
MFQASGASIDAEAIVDEIARLKNRPEFKRFITFANPAEMLGGDENTVRQAANTTRETIRKNVSTGGTDQARNSAMIQTLMGGKPQVNAQQRNSMLQGVG